MDDGKPDLLLETLQRLEKEVREIRAMLERIENDRPRNTPVLEAYPWASEPTDTDPWKYRWKGDTGTWWPDSRSWTA